MGQSQRDLINAVDKVLAEAEEIDAYFPELRDLVPQCQFSDCTHKHEPGCAVLAALKAGTVHPERYDSYLRLRAGQE